MTPDANHQGAAPPSADPVAPRPHLILAICCMSLLLVGMDVTIVNVALPSIQHDLHAPLSDLQWIMDAYTLVIASLLMLAGSASDRFGRRRTFQCGLAVFTLGSVACSLAPNIAMLIAFRTLQGLGACMLNPVALSIITNVFQDPKARAQAMGIWGSVMGISLALGPLAGGALTQSFGWRAIFLVNAPIGVAALILTARYVPESRAPQARAFDPVGQLLVFIGLACLTAAVIEGPRLGWQSPFTIGFFVVAMSAIAGFLLYEPRRAEPLVDLRFFRSVPFSGATLIAVLSFACFASFLFLNAIYLQQSRGLSAFDAGISTLPLAVTALIGAPLSGRLVGNHGTRPSLLIAGVSFLLSTLMLTGLSQHSPLPWLLVAYGLFGIGLGMVNPAISQTAVSGMPRGQVGVAAAIASTSRQIGASLGVAIAGTVVNISQIAGTDFAQATRAVWWAMAACAAALCVLGWLTSTPWAMASTRRIESLL